MQEFRNKISHLHMFFVPAHFQEYGVNHYRQKELGGLLQKNYMTRQLYLIQCFIPSNISPQAELFVNMVKVLTLVQVMV